ncbi:MAG: membrane protein insertion efficiency factor YidD [Alphaproteobacteria bacterium]|nr:membrane protein insertion efficiency factor YidD [Alphaproteobacteria bacterium]
MKTILLILIRIYQLTLSSFMGRGCRYLPTCSDYARQAIEKHGAACGSVLAAKRIARCHPWGGHGYDPVPATCQCLGHKQKEPE